MLPTSTLFDVKISEDSTRGGSPAAGDSSCDLNGNNSENCECVGELIRRIIALRRLSTTQDGEYSVINNNEVKWANLFMEFILGTAFCQAQKCQAHSDDMIWYVHQMKINSSFYLGHSLDFYVTCAVCTQTSPRNLEIIRKNCKKVYPSPSRRRMDSKGESEEITYPKLYFAIDGFEEAFQDIVVRDGECVCVELVARDRQKTREAVIFLGSIRYDVLRQVYDAKASTSWNWAQKLMKQGGRRQEFVGMRGPHKKGYAEMAVARVLNCGYETPLTENNIDFSELAGVEHTLNRRRMSETNLSGPKVFTRPSIMQGAQMPYNRRWQSETDTANQYPEVEGSNIDDDLDEGVLTRLWSVRGFGQAWHWLREKKRAECTPLNAYLTYVTLSCTSILKDLLSDRPKRPILTFEFESSIGQ